jgi:hypothetical protein
MGALETVEEAQHAREREVQQAVEQKLNRYRAGLKQAYDLLVMRLSNPRGSIRCRLGEIFPNEGWKIIDLEPVFQKSAYGTCQPTIVISDESGTFFLAVGMQCAGTFWWWADPVATAGDYCHWSIRDLGPGEGQDCPEYGERDPSAALIGLWLRQRQAKDRRHPTGGERQFREKVRQHRLAREARA